NAHVVVDSEDITVSTNEQKEYSATLIGIDKRTDVALLKIDKTDTPAVKIGNSDQLEVGNWVLAIGSPFGFDHTATAGIISAVSRSLPDGTYVPFIQTDAAVNPGNSGGPLFNLKGEVIGINSQIYSNTGAFNGLAFAIPINTAMNIAEQLKNKGFVSRGWLGIGIQKVNQALAASFGLETPKGALVANVSPNSPAEQAGLQLGDIILSFNGKLIQKESDLPPLVGTVAVGKIVSIKVLRSGKVQMLNVKVGELDDGQPKRVSQTKGKMDLGFRVRDLAAKEQIALSVKGGVVVIGVSSGSVASVAGFRLGDVIINIDNHNISSMKDFNRMLKQLGKDKPVAVLVVRNGRSLFIPLSP
ncbi:MAG: Do family serine endopeptidase, partial [Ostreibacterium sp.]